MAKQTAAEYFKENHYVVIENFISKETASFLYDYVKMAADRLTFAEYQVPNFDKEFFGSFDDEQKNKQVKLELEPYLFSPLYLTE